MIIRILFHSSGIRSEIFQEIHDKLLHVEELPDTGKPVDVQSKDIQLQDVSFSYDKESGKQVHCVLRRLLAGGL